MVCLKSFCCCCDTRTGCIIIGYATGGLSVISCVGSVMRLILGLPLVLQNDDLQGQFPFNPLFFVFSAIYFAFHTIASFAVVPAVKEGNEMFIVPTIVMLLVDIVLDCTAIIVMVMKLVKQSPLENILIGGITIGVLFLPLLMYSTLIVISQFEELFNRPDKIPLQKRKSSKSLLCAQSMDSSGSSETSTGTLV